MKHDVDPPPTISVNSFLCKSMVDCSPPPLFLHTPVEFSFYTTPLHNMYIPVYKPSCARFQQWSPKHTHIIQAEKDNVNEYVVIIITIVIMIMIILMIIINIIIMITALIITVITLVQSVNRFEQKSCQTQRETQVQLNTGCQPAMYHQPNITHASSFPSFDPTLVVNWQALTCPSISTFTNHEKDKKDSV